MIPVARIVTEDKVIWRKAVFVEDIEALPPVDAEPVRSGKWEMKPDPFGFFHDIPVCSECGCTTKMREKTKYCHNCGARMEERMMTLDEAITHCEEVADYDCYNEEQMKCANEHRQLAKWLTELKELRSLQTAKKPKWKAEDRFVTNRFQQFPYCPHCGYEIVTGDCHCRVCGQHIDWEEDDAE